MIHIHRIRRLGGALAALACAMLGLAMAAPAAFAMQVATPIGDDGYVAPAPAAQTVTHVVVMGGMPGWQIALIATGAAVLAAAVTVLAYRALTTHRRTALPAA